SAWTPIGRIAAERGDFDLAAQALQRSDRLSSQAGVQWTGPNAAAFAITELWRGDPDAARTALRRGLIELEAAGWATDFGDVLSLYARACADVVLRERLIGETENAAAIEADARSGIESREESAMPEAQALHRQARAELARLAEPPDPAPWLTLVARWDELGH